MKNPRLVTLRPNGHDAIVLRPKKLVDASQAYFWTDEWQAAEREASEDSAKGRVKTFHSAEALVRDLNKTRAKRR